MDYSLHIKMAEGGRTYRNTERRVASVRAQVLLDAIEFFENRRRGRASIPLPNSMRTPHDGNRDGWEVDQSQQHGRAKALDMLVPGLGCLSTMERKRQGSLSSYTCNPANLSTQTCRACSSLYPLWYATTAHGEGKRQRLPSSIPMNTPPPQEDCTPPVRCCEAPSDNPEPCPFVYIPLVIFQLCPPIQHKIQMAPIIMMTYSHPSMPLLTPCSGSGLVALTITISPPPVCSMTLLPTTPHIFKHSQSHQTLMCS